MMPSPLQAGRGRSRQGLGPPFPLLLHEWPPQRLCTHVLLKRRLLPSVLYKCMARDSRLLSPPSSMFQ